MGSINHANSFNMILAFIVVQTPKSIFRRPSLIFRGRVRSEWLVGSPFPLSPGPFWDCDFEDDVVRWETS